MFRQRFLFPLCHSSEVPGNLFQTNTLSCVSCSQTSTGIKRANSGGYWKLPGQADKVDYFPFSYFLQLEKTGLRSFRPGLTQTRLCNHTMWLEA